MTRRDPLLPNARIVAGREYRDRVRSPFFLISTIVLMTLALGVSMAPVALRWVDRHSVTHVLVVADDATLAARAVSVADSILNVPPSGVRAHSTSISLTATSGFSRTNGTKSRRSMTINSQSVTATASAVRGCPSSSAISPKISPSWITLRTVSRPLGPVTEMRTLPESTAISAVPAWPLAKIVVPRRTLRVRR